MNAFSRFFSKLFSASIFHRFLVDSGGLWEAKLAPKSSFFVFRGVAFSRRRFCQNFSAFFKWRHAFRLAWAQSKRMSAISDEGRKSNKKSMKFEIENRRKSLNHRLQKHVFFDLVFGWILERFWEGFGISWASPGGGIRGK